MNKYFIAVTCCIVIFIVSVPSFAIIFPGISYLSDDQIMSQLLPKGKVDISAKIEYWSPYEEYIDNTAGAMQPLAANKSSYTLINIPIRVSYGLMKNLSLRFTTQYINRNVSWTDFNGRHLNFIGNGLGDAKIEMLYQIAKETSDKPSIAVNVGADILTGKNYIALPNAASDTSLDTGLWGPSYYLSGIFGKKCGNWNTKAMIGYIFLAANKVGSWTWTMPNQLICSLMMSTKAGNDLEYGGELSAKFSGEENWDIPPVWWIDPDAQGYTPLTRISIAPFVVWNQSADMSIKGMLEIPLAMKGSDSTADLNLNEFRGLNISVGANWRI